MTPDPRTPSIVVADDDPASRALIEEELLRRYGEDYDVRVCETCDLHGILDAVAADDGEVAVALAICFRGARACA